MQSEKQLICYLKRGKNVEKIGNYFRYSRAFTAKSERDLKGCDYILHAGDVDRPELLDELRPHGICLCGEGEQ